MYERCGMGPCANGLKFGVVEWVKSILWGDLAIWRERREDFVKEVSEIVGPRCRGRPAVRWKDRVKDYMHEIDADRGREFKKARTERWREQGSRDYRIEYDRPQQYVIHQKIGLLTLFCRMVMGCHLTVMNY